MCLFFPEFKSEKDIRSNGMFVSLTDCVYRTGVIDNYKYVANTDFDEVLMPIKNESLLELIQRFDDNETHSFVFRNTFLYMRFGQDYSTVPEENGLLNFPSTKGILHLFFPF